MVTESTNLQLNWPRLSGVILDGGYELREVIEADAVKATFRVRVLGDHTANAYAEMFPAEGPAAAEQVELWQNARRLSHPNLRTPLGAGQTDLDGSGLIYLVLNRADERLSGVLAERPLEPAEAGEVLTSGIRALQHLHANGFVHGCVSPDQVLAIGDSIKLSSAYVHAINVPPPLDLIQPKYVAPESAGGPNLTPAADVWCLGATIFEALTGLPCTADCEQTASQLPAPFPAIVQRALNPDPQNRCSLHEMLALLNGTAAAAPIEPAAVRPEPVPPVAPPPAEADRPAIQRVRRPRNVNRPSMPPRAWIYAAVAILIIIAVIWGARSRRATNSHAPVTAAAITTPAAPVPSGRAWETRTLTPPDSTPKRPVPPPVTVVSKPQPAYINGSIWRVVLYTYARRDDAEKKAHSVNEKHPDLTAEVFAPNAHGGPYLVTAGGRMSRDDAAKLRQKAVRLGMPHDSYIQNYKQ